MKTSAKKKLTIMLDAEVYKGLRQRVGARGIGVYLSNLAKPYVVESTLDAGYQAMATDEEQEREAREWIEEGIETPLGENVWQF